MAGLSSVTTNLSVLETTTSESALDSDTQEEIERLNQITIDIYKSYIWVIFALGFPGNIFSIATVLTMQTMTPATFLVAMLAFCDGCTLIIKLIGHQLLLHRVYLGSAGCKSLFLPGFLGTLANWILVLICFERFISVCFPLKKVYLITKRRTYMSVAVLSVVSLLIFSILYGVMRDSDLSGLHCGTYNDYLHFWTWGWYWINTFLYLLIPFSCIVILTALIIRGLTKSRRDRRSIFHNGTDNQDNNRRLVEESERLERSITIMLILAAIIFLLLALPACVYILAYRQSPDPLTNARWALFDQIQYVLTDSSHAVNFFLYFFSAQRFRQQFFHLLTCKIWRKKGQRARCHECTTYATKYTIARSTEDVSQL